MSLFENTNPPSPAQTSADTPQTHQACLPTVRHVHEPGTPIPDDAFATTGTEAGYYRHRRHGQDACPPCAAAATYWKRQRRAAKARRAAWLEPGSAGAELASHVHEWAMNNDVNPDALVRWLIMYLPYAADIMAADPSLIAQYVPAPDAERGYLPNPDHRPTPTDVRQAQIPRVDGATLHEPWTSIEQSLWAP